jgi:uncharacterized protein YjaG (DUF416 family)
MVEYDESQNLVVLRRLPMKLRVVFALLCTTRIFPAYCRFHNRTHRGDPAMLELMMERLWRDIHGEEMTMDEIERAVDRVVQLVPSEADGWDEESQPYAEDAAAALAYVLRARLTGDPQEAAWAARRVYEAVDHFVVSTLPAAQREAERTVLGHPVVQAELSRQQRDLDELSVLASYPTEHAQINRLRRRSEQEAESLFSF